MIGFSVLVACLAMDRACISPLFFPSPDNTVLTITGLCPDLIKPLYPPLLILLERQQVSFCINGEGWMLCPHSSTSCLWIQRLRWALLLLKLGCWFFSPFRRNVISLIKKQPMTVRVYKKSVHLLWRKEACCTVDWDSRGCFSLKEMRQCMERKKELKTMDDQWEREGGYVAGRWVSHESSYLLPAHRSRGCWWRWCRCLQCACLENGAVFNKVTQPATSG